MHTGFYEDLDVIRAELLFQGDIRNPSEIDFCFMENEAGINGYSPFDFLHGLCDIFAAYMNDKYGYDAYQIYDANGNLIHAFCISGTVNGHPIYADIRGETNDLEEMLAEFDLEEQDLPYFLGEGKFFTAGDFSIIKGRPQYVKTSDAAYKTAKWLDEYYKICG